MWGWVRNVAVTLFLVLPATAAGDESDPERWLDRMTESLHLQSYEGTFVFQRGDRIDTVRVVHAADEGGYRERLQTLTGSAREVVRSVDRLSALKGARAEGERAGEGAPQWPPAIAGALVRASDRYQLQSPGFDRIAGFPCYLLQAKARDELRYSHTYCLHRETGLPLLSELIDSGGQLLERMVFTELEFLDVVFEDALQARGCDARHIDVRVPSEDTLQQAAHDQWSFEDLPPGFTPVIVTERSFGPDAPPSLHFVLSDGLATVSVYVDASDQVSETFEGATRSGATHAVARPLSGHQLTVVGEVPRQTAEWIAGSARYLGDDAPDPGR
ncbi:MucB/RseB C-terminal domain-containing protein [Thioalkalivibrio paradoxus]|uniref:Sigma E regulatory protein, MucB/RseB n=1 Tax=Thioalkalivibrio paradoxus ARh 1 TaxID=713585 RepID=W0DP30_9GAMM|nr:MucB/RseB C-terminal domain-containing protein [Thioalkalivibrio paradoxus]AHF00197.1 hypothetical protein THITH_12170 [Thioalkalivibrio paradoxus ARh 1]